ncbi:MAG: LysR family transcriptional regulator [Gulosibacter sp.]|uniref:LysR family transcriptional regulator n=1 Tax=Gulosibacter sp. TaxID=2817531 RepID=UPI003F92ACDB
MRTFVTVARASSFTAAADELGISPSLVSRQVAALETDLGVRLVNRTPRTLQLTEAGTEYAKFANRILKEIESQHSRLAEKKDAEEGKISIISPKWIGLIDLGKAIGDYLRDHPNTQVHFELGGLSDRIYDFLDRGFDVAFHARDLRDSRVRVRRITDLEFALVTSREYLAEHGAPETVADLRQHPLVTHSSDTSWKFVTDGESKPFNIQKPFAQTNAYTVIGDFLLAGRGVGVIPRGLVRSSLEAGDLVELLPDTPIESRTLYAVQSPGPQSSARVTGFIDFMVEWYRRQSAATTTAV